jgi:hypothetical protein
MSPFGELYFSNPSEFAITPITRDSQAYARYRAMLLSDLKKYISTDSPDFDPTKAIKRGYALLKLDGEKTKAEQLSRFLLYPDNLFYSYIKKLHDFSNYLQFQPRTIQPVKLLGHISYLIGGLQGMMKGIIMIKEWSERVEEVLGQDSEEIIEMAVELREWISDIGRVEDVTPITQEVQLKIAELEQVLIKKINNSMGKNALASEDIRDLLSE